MPSLDLSDSHVHLDRYGDAEVTAMLRSAADAGVRRVLAVSVDLESACRTVALAKKHPILRAGIGLHPLRSGADAESVFAALAQLARAEPLVRAVGEVGLDLSPGAPPAAVQEHAFRWALRLARTQGLPVFFHNVGADDESLEILRTDAAGVPVVMHYFTGDRRRAERFLDAGCSLSFGKPVTRPAEAALREAARATPLERLLVETDTYPLPGRTTQPRDVAYVVAAIAALKGLPASDVARATSANLRLLLSPQ